MTMLGAVGIGVSDLEKSIHFFTKVLDIGLSQTQTFDVDLYKEAVLTFPPGTKPTSSAILLMQYKDKSLPKPINQQGKMVFYVDDVEAVFKRCKEHGCEVMVALGAHKAWPNMCMLKVPGDLYVVEFMPKPWVQKAKAEGKGGKDSKI